ncbi:hypothetical protein RD110_21860 [Rhodoferax koreense]|uniref:Transposase n=1 Tax=Rhodoferax koreensis TaxID=1842727 RepID=A0A1P8K0L2_9BURK|nr:hypothetical protein RD110_21860 [Rhodoferax koreense]
MTDRKKSRFSEEQIIGFLRQAEAGMPIKELCRNGAFSDAMAVTARCTVDVDEARPWVTRAGLAWMPPAKPFEWPFQVGDLLWLFREHRQQPAPDGGHQCGGQQQWPGLDREPSCIDRFEAGRVRWCDASAMTSAN